MTLIEALKSGAKTVWMPVSGRTRLLINSFGSSQTSILPGWISVNYLLSGVEMTHELLCHEGWKAKPDEVTITGQKLAEAWDKHVGHYAANSSQYSQKFSDFAKELGL